ncbi:MAG: hypothetical protein RL885_14195 [Planctomycetota bacterium]
MHLSARTLLLVTGLAGMTAGAQDPAQTSVDDENAIYAFRSLEMQDVARVAELYRLTDTFGPALWPGFDTRQIPIAVNHDDREEMLFAHPAPPSEFEPTDALRIAGQPVLIRDGSTRYGPRGGGWAVDLAGHQTAYVCTLQPRQSTEEYLSLLIHECFHVYQRRFQAMPSAGWKEAPEDDAEYCARIGLESAVLQAMLVTEDDERIRELARQFVAVRQARYALLDEAQIRGEAINEYNEGTATYVQARLYQLLADRGAPEPESEIAHYGRFENAGRLYADTLSRIDPPDDQLIQFHHCQYQNGMAICLALDRLRPSWKMEMKEAGRTQYDLLAIEMAVAQEDEAALLEKAEEQFGYANLLAAQTGILEERLATIRGYLDAPGRRYRIHHREIAGRFNWKPAGPVYRAPTSMLDDQPPNGASVWAGGILRFERGELDFTGQPVPMIFRQDYLEWIDPEPTEGDLVIESESQEGDVHTEVKIRTDGFEMTVPKARIVRTEGRVDIHPIDR